MISRRLDGIGACEDTVHHRVEFRKGRRHRQAPASARVRLHARRDLAGWVGVSEEELEIVCDEGPAGRMPPRVLLRGEPAPWSVGLSHHGRWLAWVLARL